MRKIGLTLGALLLSFNCYAGSISTNTDLKSAIIKNESKQIDSNKNPSIIYGGQDISRPVIADADESASSIQPKLVS